MTDYVVNVEGDCLAIDFVKAIDNQSPYAIIYYLKIFLILSPSLKALK